MYDPQKLQVIIDECVQQYNNIGATPRAPERIQRDAELIYIQRHEGITPETIAMMLSDTEFAVKKYRDATQKLIAAAKDVINGQNCVYVDRCVGCQNILELKQTIAEVEKACPAK